MLSQTLGTPLLHFFPDIWWPLSMSCHGQGYPKSSKCSVVEMFQLLIACGKELSFRMEQFPKLTKLGNAAHHAGSTQVSTKLKFSINCCVIGKCNMTCWEPSFLANILERNNCILLTVAHSLSRKRSLVLPCRRAIWEFVFIFQVLEYKHKYSKVLVA